MTSLPETEKRLSEITAAINILSRRGTNDPVIKGMAYDSREVKPGFLFFALPGIHTDGHRFIPMALEKGAAAVIHTSNLDSYEEGIVYLKVENSRTLMSPVAAAFYNYPSRNMGIAGVTGTDGKSSTVAYLHQLISASGEKCGFLSTVEFHNGRELKKNAFRQSTPEAPEVHQLLNEMYRLGCGYAVVESTSHGLSPKNNRLGDVDYNVGILTNISHEHLEFHGTMEQYASDKSRLMAGVETAVLPAEEPWLDTFLNAAGSAEILLYGCNSTKADYNAVDIREDQDGLHFRIKHPEGEVDCYAPLQGLFNVDNALAALLGASRLLGVAPESLAPLLAELKPVRGRMQPVNAGQAFNVLIDYAHSPGSFEKLFPLMRSRCAGKLIAVFGSAGERDREKRPIQGAIACRYCDIIVLSDEDPRGEDRNTIISEIAAGCSGKTKNSDLFLIPDREEGIYKACSMAEAGDLVICLGKGHEGSIIGPEGSVPYDEEECVRKALFRLGYGK